MISTSLDVMIVLCFTSKFYADLHQLETQPETSSVRDHILYSTNQHFTRLHHQKLHSIYGRNPKLVTGPKQRRWVELQREKYGLV